MRKSYTGNDLTAVIPAHNCEPYIFETLRSLESQVVRPVQVIVVENASSDRTFDCVKDFAETSDLSIRLVQTDCLGVSNARNIGFSLAETDLIAMLDADDLYQPDFLKRAVGAFNKLLNLVLFFGNRKPLQDGQVLDKLFLEETRLAKLPFEEPEAELRKITGDLFSELVYGSFVSCSGAVVRRRAAYEAGLFPSMLSSSEDRFFFCSLALQGPAAYTLKTTHLYRTHEASKTSRSSRVDTLKNALICLQMLRLESVRKGLSCVQRETLGQAFKDNRAALLYMASDAGLIELRHVRLWALNVGISVSTTIFHWLKAAKNELRIKR